MKTHTMILAAALAFFTVSIAGAKGYDISFSLPTKAGSVQLAPGTYHLTVSGNKATFTNTDNSKSFTTDVKVENSAKKFDQTIVDSVKDGGSDVIKDIRLGGSTNQLDF